MLPLYEDGIYGFNGEYRFLSNFWPAEVEFDGWYYPTVEHAYQAAKCLELESRVSIQAAVTPGVAKRMGRFIKMRSDWDHIKVPVMRNLLEQKFSIPELRNLLLLTKDKYIEETNTWNDTFWGVCNGTGKNIMGNLLMKIRSDLMPG